MSGDNPISASEQGSGQETQENAAATTTATENENGLNNGESGQSTVEDQVQLPNSPATAEGEVISTANLASTEEAPLDAKNLVNRTLSVVDIAKVCHEANRTYCQSIGDDSQKPWEEAEQWQRDSAVKGVEFRQQNPDAPFAAQHESWMKEKVEAGWTYGEVKDAEKKQHPCIVAWKQLPIEQRRKDALFAGIVTALS